MDLDNCGEFGVPTFDGNGCTCRRCDSGFFGDGAGTASTTCSLCTKANSHIPGECDVFGVPSDTNACSCKKCGEGYVGDKGVVSTECRRCVDSTSAAVDGADIPGCVKYSTPSETNDNCLCSTCADGQRGSNGKQSVYCQECNQFDHISHCDLFGPPNILTNDCSCKTCQSGYKGNAGSESTSCVECSATSDIANCLQFASPSPDNSFCRCKYCDDKHFGDQGLHSSRCDLCGHNEILNCEEFGPVNSENNRCTCSRCVTAHRGNKDGTLCELCKDAAAIDYCLVYGSPLMSDPTMCTCIDCEPGFQLSNDKTICETCPLIANCASYVKGRCDCDRCEYGFQLADDKSSCYPTYHFTVLIDIHNFTSTENQLERIKKGLEVAIKAPPEDAGKGGLGLGETQVECGGCRIGAGGSGWNGMDYQVFEAILVGKTESIRTNLELLKERKAPYTNENVNRKLCAGVQEHLDAHFSCSRFDAPKVDPDPPNCKLNAGNISNCVGASLILGTNPGRCRCDLCKAGWRVVPTDSTKCELCDAEITNCSTYGQASVFQPTQCVCQTCNTAFHSNVDKTKCLSCADQASSGFIEGCLKFGEPLVSDGSRCSCVRCGEGYKGNSDNSLCVRCTDGEVPNGQGDVPNCDEFDAPAENNNHVCVCKKCASKFHLDAVNQTQCLPCDNTIASCAEYGGTEDPRRCVCKSCTSGFFGDDGVSSGSCAVCGLQQIDHCAKFGYPSRQNQCQCSECSPQYYGNKGTESSACTSCQGKIANCFKFGGVREGNACGCEVCDTGFVGVGPDYGKSGKCARCEGSSQAVDFCSELDFPTNSNSECACKQCQRDYYLKDKTTCAHCDQAMPDHCAVAGQPVAAPNATGAACSCATCSDKYKGNNGEQSDRCEECTQDDIKHCVLFGPPLLENRACSCLECVVGWKKSDPEGSSCVAEAPGPNPGPTPQTPTSKPSVSPLTKGPTAQPTKVPGPVSPLTRGPTAFPTGEPSSPPTIHPTARPTNVGDTNPPTHQPSLNPTGSPAHSPTHSPSFHPPTKHPTTGDPSHPPTLHPTARPTNPGDTNPPTHQPTWDPTGVPSNPPTEVPTTGDPSSPPTLHPTAKPTNVGDTNPPTHSPTSHPSGLPSHQPSEGPTKHPSSGKPSHPPTIHPTAKPTNHGDTNPPTHQPTLDPTSNPSRPPTDFPTTGDPSHSPTLHPTAKPTNVGDTNPPTLHPTNKPPIPPSGGPTHPPSKKQPTTSDPTRPPSIHPTAKPTNPGDTNPPTHQPTMDPTSDPSFSPTIPPTYKRTFDPSDSPTLHPTARPTNVGDTNPPTHAPSDPPTKNPVSPTKHPTTPPPTPTIPPIIRNCKVLVPEVEGEPRECKECFSESPGYILSNNNQACVACTPTDASENCSPKEPSTASDGLSKCKCIKCDTAFHAPTEDNNECKLCNSSAKAQIPNCFPDQYGPPLESNNSQCSCTICERGYVPDLSGGTSCQPCPKVLRQMEQQSPSDPDLVKALGKSGAASFMSAADPKQLVAGLTAIEFITGCALPSLNKCTCEQCKFGMELSHDKLECYQWWEEFYFVKFWCLGCKFYGILTKKCPLN